MHPARKIISGGQAGVDRAALDIALELGIECGGWCPKGRGAEDGRIGPKYPLLETGSEDPNVRTERNVRDSDATLIFTWGKPTGGTAYTIKMAEKLGLKAAVPAHYQCFVKRTYDPWDWAKLFPADGPESVIIPYNSAIVYPG